MCLQVYILALAGLLQTIQLGGGGRIWVSTFEIAIIGLLSSAEVAEEMKDAENKQQLSVTGVV